MDFFVDFLLYLSMLVTYLLLSTDSAVFKLFCCVFCSFAVSCLSSFRARSSIKSAYITVIIRVMKVTIRVILKGYQLRLLARVIVLTCVSIFDQTSLY